MTTTGPDILEVIADLSNDEVFTPPKVANAVLDLLPEDVWTNPDLRWLDPATKTGVFLREVTKRLMVGLEPAIPDEGERLTHILTNMVFGVAITELTSLMARRSLYCSKDASSGHSVVPLPKPEGNIWFNRVHHSYDKSKCTECGATESQLERGEERENYAYAFIHSLGRVDIWKDMDMKFDVIVGNPPYQLGASGGESAGGFAMPIYQKFVDQAISLAPKYVAMITPSRWFAGGRNLDEFRQGMLHDRRLRVLVDYPDASECFPGNEIKGGVSYFLWVRDNEGPCRVETIRAGSPLGAPQNRYLDEFDILVRYNLGVDILRKVQQVNNQLDLSRLADRVSPIQPFSLRTNFKGASEPDGLADPIALYGNRSITYIERSDVPRNESWVDQWKVLIGSAYGAGEGIPHQVIGVPIVTGPATACTETYLVVDRFKTKREASNLAAYLQTRFVRFLIYLRKNTQHLYSERFAFVPILSMDREWTDEVLYEKYGITEDEQAYIAEMVKEMPA